MRYTRKSLIVLLAGLGAVLTVTDRSLGGSLSYYVTGSNRSPGYLPQSDPSYGPLTSITYSGSVEAMSLYLFNEPVSSVAYEASAEISLINLAPYSTIATIVVPEVSGTYYWNPVTGGEISATLNVPAGSLDVDSYFYGTGQLALGAGSFVGIQDDLGQDAYQSTSFGLWITYNYLSSAPEPPGLVLATIAAILPLSLIVRKRFIKRA